MIRGDVFPNVPTGRRGEPIGKTGEMRVHLVDGTYELFRQHFGATAGGTRTPGEFDATVGTLASTIQLLADGATTLVSPPIR